MKAAKPPIPDTKPWELESPAAILGSAEHLVYQAMHLVDLAGRKLSAGNVDCLRVALDIKQLRKELEQDLFHLRDVRGRANRLGGA